MTEYKCPYCGQNSYAKSSKKSGKFQDWASVRSHIVHCKANTHSYTICEYYGPISLNTLNKYLSVRAFKKDYPNCSFSTQQWRTLRINGKTSIRRNIWNKESCIAALKKFVNLFGRIPTVDDFNTFDLSYPVQRTLVIYFGSFNKAIEAAGFVPNTQNGFGINTQAKDGKIYRSTPEAYFVDNFLFEKYQYEYEKPYGNGCFYDFYLPELDLHIELDGGLRPQRIQEKIEFNRKNKINCLVIKTEEIYKKEFRINSGKAFN